MACRRAARPERNDDELLAAHVAGDRYALEELIGRHRQSLQRLARRYSNCPEDAADAMQDAMLSVHRHAGAFRHDAAVGSWLHRIVLHACWDRLRHSRSHATCEIDERICPATDPTAQLATALMVRDALRRLPLEQRAAVVAVDMHGYSVADTAQVLGVAEGTVKSRRARARSRLAILLAPPQPA